MDQRILEQLKQITPEEQSYLDGGDRVKKELYTVQERFEIEARHFLEAKKLITVRPHSRFVEFPEHGHNYVEMMYVCQGQITHVIDGKELVMEQGDLLLLNQHVRHRIRKAGYEDIGINFIAQPEFFEIPFQMLQKRSVIADFLISILRQESQGAGSYLLFRLNGEQSIDNLMENMVRSLLQRTPNEDSINQYSMGLVFLYLLNHLDSLTQSSTYDYHEVVLQAILHYIDVRYKTASLTEISGELHQSLSVLSRMIRERTGFTFQELLLRKRLQKAVMLLLESDLTVDEIGAAVGYDNMSYFHRKFKERYGQTPARYRREHREESTVRI
ncbi:MAG TPA: helix-turn-helix domain-containing protein [Candidatus Ventrimonas merdavium]|nr:helix-turn-helix domain-containing protein [Candidatus Ventrimonas merdavium]